MVWVCTMNQQQLHHRKVSSSTSQGQWSVVIVGGGFVHICTLYYEELHRAQVARPAGLHKGRAASLTLMLLENKRELG